MTFKITRPSQVSVINKLQLKQITITRFHDSNQASAVLKGLPWTAKDIIIFPCFSQKTFRKRMAENVHTLTKIIWWKSHHLRSPIKSHIHAFIQLFNSEHLLSSSVCTALQEFGALGTREADGTVPALRELKNQWGNNYNPHFTDE